MLFLLLAKHWSHGEAGLVETVTQVCTRGLGLSVKGPGGLGKAPYRAPDSDISFLGQASGTVAMTGCAHQRVHCPAQLS